RLRGEPGRRDPGDAAVVGAERAGVELPDEEPARHDADVDLEVRDLAGEDLLPRRAAVVGAVEPLAHRVAVEVADLAPPRRAGERRRVHLPGRAVEEEAPDGQPVQRGAAYLGERLAAVGRLEDSLAGVAEVRRRLARADVDRLRRRRVDGD